MVSRKNYNLNANEGFVIFSTSELFTCFIDGFTLKIKSQSTVFLLNWNKHIFRYWILNLEGEVHSIRDLWISNLQKCEDKRFLKGGRTTLFSRVQKIWIYGTGGCPARTYLPPKKFFLGGGGEVEFNVLCYGFLKHIT